MTPDIVDCVDHGQNAYKPWKNMPKVTIQGSEGIGDSGLKTYSIIPQKLVFQP